MAVDEFGREIPAGRGRREDKSPSPYRGDGPSRLHEALPTSRYGRDSGGGGGGHHYGGGGSGNSNHHFDNHHGGHHHSSHHHNSHGGGSYGHHGGGRSHRKRKHRDDDSPPPSLGRRKSNQPHPSEAYTTKAMLCQYLWKEENPDSPDEDYEEYRKSFCLNYVRTFFNQHMDDSWFRNKYSPLGNYRSTLQERARATQEAKEFQVELETSLAKNADKGRCFFVLKARLGGGIKQSRSASNSLPGDDYHQSSSYHYGSPAKKSTQTSSLSNPVPGAHVLALSNSILPILDVPPHVTDEQLTLALLSHCTDLKPDDLKLYSSSVASTSASTVGSSSAAGAATVGDLFRTVYVVCTESVRKEMIQQLNHMDRSTTATSGDGDGASSGGGAHVPRKEDTYIPKTLQLEVECSDAYGREKIDADGKGEAKDDGDDGSIPSRKATVWVSTQPLASSVAVLSVAVSSKARIPKDAQVARELAKAYDVRNQIPSECRFENLLAKAIPGTVSEDEATPQDVEDTLDLAIAYLRRVHLFSFYNGAKVASNVADVLNGNSATSTIHLRLGIADEILQQATNTETTNPATSAGAKDENADGGGNDENGEASNTESQQAAPAVDLLVQRLDNALEKALEKARVWLDDPERWSQVVVSPEIDDAARTIEQDETQVEPLWIQNHAQIDEDGRARCSFHFCRKLFKDSTFLKKHLLKKHSEYLRAEIAKCHDESMMKAWDLQECRPCPPVMVDCGRAFSMVPSPVIGAAVPLAADPEPELWRRQEERRQQKDEEEQARRERYHQSSYHNGAPDLDAPLSEERAPAHRSNNGGNFVDVDDMQEEKVDLAFDEVDIPVQPPKKKKKKKKLL